MRRLLPLLVLLAACDSPSPRMIGAERAEVVRNGRMYIVYRKDETVEVIRTGYAARGAHHGVRADMIAVIPEATGCTLIESTLVGDSGEMRGRLRCPG